MANSEISIFISHSWADVEQYRDLENLLHSISSLDWRNVSVLRERPFQTATQGEPARQQELQLQENRLALLEVEQHQLWSTIREAELKKREAERKNDRWNKVMEAKRSPFASYMLNLLALEFNESIETLQAMAEAPEEELIKDDMSAARLRSQGNSQEIEACRRRIEQLRRDCGLGVYTIRYDSRDIVYRAPKVAESAINEDPNLVLMLQDQIRSADVVIVIAEMFAQYRRWMDCELALAQGLGRPIIAIVPLGQAGCPKELKTRADVIVPWDVVALGKALLTLANRQV